MLFKDEYAFLSNMFECCVIWKGIPFKSSETLYQMFKCKNIEDMKQFQNLNGYQAKKLGRKVDMRPDWNSVRINYMEYVLRLKFEQNLKLQTRLLEVKGPIVEDNYWKDTFWGVCNGVGENNLGKLLMKLRKEYGGE